MSSWLGDACMGSDCSKAWNYASSPESLEQSVQIIEMRKMAVSGGRGLLASCPKWRHGEKGLGENVRSLRLAHVESFAKWVVK